MMMDLPFLCLECKHKFTTIDEPYVVCPKCKGTKVKVDWGKYK